MVSPTGTAADVSGAWRFLPGLYRLRHYERGWLRPDVLAGAGVAAYLIPQVMAYAEVAGLPAIVGLWAISVALLCYALLGSSRQLSVGPESTTALMTAAVVGPLAAGDPARYAALAAALALVVGGLCLVARVARLGVLAELLSKPVLIGYLAGIAVLMIVSQLGKVTGVPVSGDSTIAEVASFVRGLDQRAARDRAARRRGAGPPPRHPRSLPAGTRAADRDAGRGRGGRRPVPRRARASGSSATSRADCPPSPCPPSA